MSPRPLITLLTDFGTVDGYAAEVKGVILAAVPDAQVVDVSHDLPTQDVEAGRLALARYWRRFPKGTIHVAVVDPGVGTGRAALAVASDGRLLVGPDNGILSPALLFAGARAVALPIPASASATFHGRDVFAPAAARLASGTRLSELGRQVTDPYRSPLPSPHFDGSAWSGEVMYVDRFGTLITNLRAEQVEPGVRLAVGGTDVGPLRATFGDVERGQFVAFVGSGGTVEIAVRGGSAARLLGTGVGAEVRA